jgi:hypothetical protein
MRYILLYTYINPFADDKMRPGFQIEDQLYVLSSIRPKLTKYIELPAGSLKSDHFHEDKASYLTLAYNNSARRYNNLSGGKLVITEKILAQFRSEFGKDLIAFLIQTEQTAIDPIEGR